MKKERKYTLFEAPHSFSPLLPSFRSILPIFSPFSLPPPSSCYFSVVLATTARYEQLGKPVNVRYNALSLPVVQKHDASESKHD